MFPSITVQHASFVGITHALKFKRVNITVSRKHRVVVFVTISVIRAVCEGLHCISYLARCGLVETHLIIDYIIGWHINN